MSACKPNAPQCSVKSATASDTTKLTCCIGPLSKSQPQLRHMQKDSVLNHAQPQSGKPGFGPSAFKPKTNLLGPSAFKPSPQTACGRPGFGPLAFKPINNRLGLRPSSAPPSHHPPQQGHSLGLGLRPSSPAHKQLVANQGLGLRPSSPKPTCLGLRPSSAPPCHPPQNKGTAWVWAFGLQAQKQQAETYLHSNV